MPHFDDPSALAVRLVAESLGDLRDEVVFVGGAVIPLLATDPATLDFRPTDDVDLVTEVATRVEFGRFEEALRQRGFSHDISPGAPVCRWRVEGLVVDAMPKESTVLGFGNRWYPLVLDTAHPLIFPGGPTARVVSAPLFFATKWDAFQDRGRGTDYVGSHDLEDILTVLDARIEAGDEVERAPEEVRATLATGFRALLADSRFVDVLPGLVEPGRSGLVLDRLRRIAALAG